MSIAKRIIATVLVCLIASFAIAQNCKFDKDEVDGFTKEKMRSTMIKIGKNSFRWWIEMQQKGSKYFMTFHVFQIKDVHDIMPQGTNILIKQENGNIITLNVGEDVLPVQNVEQAAIIVTQWSPVIELTADELQILGASPVELIRTSLAGKDLNSPEIKGKQGEKIMQTAKCLLE